jgi:hypothetical protein
MSLKILDLPAKVIEDDINIFQKILSSSDCIQLHKKISLLVNQQAIDVNKDGINILTMNGESLIKSLPEIKQIHDQLLSQLKIHFENLMALDDMQIGISCNVMSSDKGHSFRMHFDRHEYTAILYLSDNSNFPLKVFTNIRTDPIFEGGKWLYDHQGLKPKYIFPEIGKLIIFPGRTTLHGVEFIGMQHNFNQRISLQFGFDSEFKSFPGTDYYGKKNN